MNSLPPVAQGSVTLILGGVRSGKSRFAQDLAARLGGDRVLYVATAETRDKEMEQRVEHHRRSRPSTWTTLERPLDVGAKLRELSDLPDVILLDCLTLLVTNILCTANPDADSIDELLRCVEKEIDSLLDLAKLAQVHLLVVSGEVGMGVVPEHLMGRMFRDLLGWANQRIAKHATTYWMLAGLPLDITRLSSSLDDAAEKVLHRHAFGETSR